MGCGPSVFGPRLRSSVPAASSMRDDAPRRAAGGRVAHLRPDVDRRAPAPGSGSGRRSSGPTPPPAHELQAADRLALGDALVVGQVVHQVEVAPPERLLLAPVPAQQLRQEPARRPARASRTAGSSGTPSHSRSASPATWASCSDSAGFGSGSLGSGRGSGSPTSPPARRVCLRASRGAASWRRSRRGCSARCCAGSRPSPASVARPTPCRPRPASSRRRRCSSRRRAGFRPSRQPVQRLELLDRVALDRRAQPLADGPEQVHEDVAAQQPVHLRLAGRVAAHQPPRRSRLVRRVVVDVDRGIRGQSVGHQVDRLLEGALLRLERHLAVFVDRPEGVEGRPAVGRDEPRLEDAEQVVDPVVERERVALDVEEEVARPRLGQARQAPVRLERAVGQPRRRQQLVERSDRASSPRTWMAAWSRAVSSDPSADAVERLAEAAAPAPRARAASASRRP